MSIPGMSEMLLIFGVIILLFGGKKLPALGTALGESIRNFRQGLNPSISDSQTLQGDSQALQGNARAPQGDVKEARK